MNHPAYPAYKESGVPWLGKVPEHWEVKRLKTAATYCVSNVDKLSKDDEIPVRLCNYTDVYYHDEITPDMDLMEATATKEEIQKFHLKVDDIVITKDSEDWSDIAIPARIRETSDDLLCGYHLAIITPNLKYIYGSFLFRAFQTIAVNQQFQLAASGVTRYGLPKSSIGESIFPLPPISEQTAIADFLDRETGRIDALVAKKRRLIELLREKRSSLISRTVTRGLPADVAREFGLEPHSRFKDSGIEWLGEVPDGWEVVELRRFIRFITSGSRGWAEHYADEGKIFVRIGNLTRHSIDVDLSDIQYVAPPAGAEGERTVISVGDILFSITAYIGSVAVATEQIVGAYINQHIALVRLFAGKVLPRYIAYAALSDFGQAQLGGQGYGGTKVQLALDDVKSLRIPVSSISEQTAIATYLDRETAKIDRLIDKVEQAVERLQEYRTALITAAVTGKIDVRGCVEEHGRTGMETA